MKKEANTYKVKYRQRLPHIQPIGASFFVTFRLFGSIPKSEVSRLKEEYEFNVVRIKQKFDGEERRLSLQNDREKYFLKVDKLLEKIKEGPHYLIQKNCRDIVINQLHRFDGTLYRLIAFSIMSNHVHILIDTSIQISDSISSLDEVEKFVPLNEIMKRIKGPISRYCNKVLDKKGQFLERESFDTYIRNDKMFNNILAYILNNPVNAGIANHWADYSGNYYFGKV